MYVCAILRSVVAFQDLSTEVRDAVPLSAPSAGFFVLTDKVNESIHLDAATLCQQDSSAPRAQLLLRNCVGLELHV